MSRMKKFNCYVIEKDLDKIQNTIEYLTNHDFKIEHTKPKILLD